jgi:hypothetical protein
MCQDLVGTGTAVVSWNSYSEDGSCPFLETIIPPGSSGAFGPPDSSLVIPQLMQTQSFLAADFGGTVCSGNGDDYAAYAGLHDDANA